VADKKDGVLAARAEPEVPVIHEELRPVLLRRDGVALDALQDLCVGHVDLEAAGGAFVRAHRAAHGDGRLLTEMVERVPDFGRDRLLEHDALDDARAVAQLREHELAARTCVVEPAADVDLFPGVA
jgi:hypothetical protein